MSAGFWIGGAKGITVNKNKFFIGWLPFGYYSEKISLNNEIQKHRGMHFGVALPLIGNQFKP